MRASRHGASLRSPPNFLLPSSPSIRLPSPSSPSYRQVTQHGACLGLGIAGLGTEDEEAFEDVKNVLYMDNAGGFCFPRFPSWMSLRM